MEFVLLDACCLINLFASGRATEILEALPYRFAVARYVAEVEVLEIESEEPGEGRDTEPAARISVHPLIARIVAERLVEQLEVVSADEHRELVRFALSLDDGEAYTCALAITRGARVATDDRKAIRVFSERRRRLEPTADLEPCLRTSDLLFAWAAATGVDDGELRRIVRDIARRASFLPPRDDPHFDRWMAYLEEFRY